MKKLFFILLASLIVFPGMAQAPPSQVSVEREEMKTLARQALKRLEIAYERENLNRFLSIVHHRFLPEEIPTLKSNLINRFDTANQIKVKIVIDNMIVDPKLGRVVVETHWKRRFLAQGQSQLTRTDGQTAFIFEIRNRHAELLDTKGDVLFG